MRNQEKPRSKNKEGLNRKQEHYMDPYSLGEQGACINPYYIHSSESSLKQHYKPRSPPHSIEPEVDLPFFYGNKNVEVYLEWDTKVDQIFEYHQVDEFRTYPLLLYIFQEHAMFWWKRRQNDVRIGRKSEILNWNELKVCLRRNFVLRSYQKK